MKRLWSEFLLGAMTTVAVFVLLEKQGRLTEVVLHGVVATVLGLAAFLGVGLIKARKAVGALLRIAKSEDGMLGKIRSEWLYDESAILTSGLAEGMRAQWTPMDRERVRRLSRVCFRRCRGKYIGTDRNVPSAFLRLYPEYLGSQRERGTRDGDLRFVLYDWTALEEDARSAPEDARVFIENHVGEGVRLLRVDWGFAKEQASKLALPSPDLGLFGGRYAVFFDPPEDPSGEFRVSVREVDRELSGRVEAFLFQLARNADQIGLDAGTPGRRFRGPEEVAADMAAVSVGAWAQK